MRIADEESHRCLAYIEAVSAQGYTLSVQELREYLREGRRTSSATAGGAFGLSELFVRRMKEAYGRSETPLAERLANMGWIRVDDHAVTITDLGRAVLRSVDAQELEADVPIQIVLNAKDPLAYAQVVNHIAKYEDAMLVDPFFKLEHFAHVVHYTSVTRLLTGPQADLAGLRVALSTLPADRPLEIRRSDELHDRFVIPPSGPLLQLGTSFSGVGKNMTVLVELNPPAADEVRRAHEELWAKATPVEPVPPEGDEGTESKAKKTAGKPSGRKKTS